MGAGSLNRESKEPSKSDADCLPQSIQTWAYPAASVQCRRRRISSSSLIGFHFHLPLMECEGQICIMQNETQTGVIEESILFRFSLYIQFFITSWETKQKNVQIKYHSVQTLNHHKKTNIISLC